MYVEEDRQLFAQSVLHCPVMQHEHKELLVSFENSLSPVSSCCIRGEVGGGRVLAGDQIKLRRTWGKKFK